MRHLSVVAPTGRRYTAELAHRILPVESGSGIFTGTFLGARPLARVAAGLSIPSVD
jgi:hypothetical protein